MSWWRSDRQGWRGQSSTVGAVLLAAVALVLVAAVGLFVFSDFGGSGESNELLLTDLGSDLTASNVTISHKGGDTLTPDEVTVLIKGANETTEISLDEFRRSGDQFTAGDVAEYTETDPTEFFIGEFTLLVVHDPSSTILHESEKSISFAKQGITLAVESKKGGLATGTTDVWGKPASSVTLSDPSEVEWDFSVSARFTKGTGQTITDDIGDAYTLSVPSQGFDGRSVSNGNSLGVLEAARVNGDTTVTVKAEYVGDNAPAGTPSNRKTSTVDVTVADPSETFDISGSIDDTTSNGQINADYTITNAGDLSIEQDISYTAIAYDASGSKVEEKTGTSITGVSSGDLTASLSPGSSTGGTANYEPPQNTEEVELRITPQIGNKFQATETFAPADFQIQNAAWRVDQDSAELANDYDITNAGSFSGTTDVTFNATAYDSSGNPIDAAGYSGVTYTNSYTNVQVDSGETLTTASGQIAPFTVPLPPGTDSVTANISTLNDTETKTLDTTPAEFTVTDVSITGISSPSNEVTVSYDIENQGGLADTQDIALKAFDDTGSGFPGTADSTTTDIGVSLAPGETYSNTVTFHTVDPTTDAVKVEVVPGGAPALGSAGQDTTTSIASANQVVTLDTVGLEHDESNDIDEIVVGFTVENTGDLTYDSPQPVDITFNNDDDSVTKTVQAKVQAGNSKSFTVRSGSLRDAFSSPAGTYTISGQGDGNGDTKTLQIKPAIAQITITGQNFDPTAQELSVDYSVFNAGDLTDDITVELYTRNSPGGSRLDSAPLDQSSATELTSDSSTTGTLTHSVRGKDIISSTVHFEVFANPSASGSNSDFEIGSASGISPPNFAIDTFTVTPDFANEEVTVDYTVRNDGDLTATRDINLTVEVAGTQEDNANRSDVQLTPGGSTSKTETLSVPEPATSADVNVTLDTGDNNQTDTRTVAPNNFQVTAVSATYNPSDETATATFDIENTGDFSATQTVTATAQTDGTTNSTDISLGPGDTVTDEKLTVDIDSSGSQTIEVATGNDTSTDTVSPDSAEFTVSITSTTSPVVEGENLSVTAEIENVGDFSATQTVDLSVGSLGSNSTSVSLAPDSLPATETFSVDTADGDAGTYTAKVSSENETASEDVTVQAPANFQMSIKSATSPVEGEDLDVDVKIDNTGDLDGTQTVELDAGALGSTSQDVTVASGNDPVKTFSIGTSSGDAGSYTAEVSSDNDTASTGVTVKEPANFQVSFDSVPDTITQGENLDVSVKVQNTGDVSGLTDVTADPGGLGSSTTKSSVTVGGESSKTLDFAFDTSKNDGGQDYTVEASESTTGDSVSTSVTVKAPTIDFDVVLKDFDDSTSGSTEVYVDETTGSSVSSGSLQSDFVPTAGSTGMHASVGIPVQEGAVETVADSDDVQTTDTSAFQYGSGPYSTAGPSLLDGDSTGNTSSKTISSAESADGKSDFTTTTQQVDMQEIGTLDTVGTYSTDISNYDYIRVTVEGGGGGGSATAGNDGDITAGGGDGGYIQAVLDVGFENSISMRVGGGGDDGNCYDSGCFDGFGGFGYFDGGDGGEAGTNADGDAEVASGGGGGASAVYEDGGTVHVIAGGGGGGAGLFDELGIGDGVASGGGGGGGGSAGSLCCAENLKDKGEDGEISDGWSVGGDGGDAVGGTAFDHSADYGDDGSYDWTGFETVSQTGYDGFGGDGAGPGGDGSDGSIDITYPDIKIKSASPSQNTIEPGDTISIDYTLENNEPVKGDEEEIKLFINGNEEDDSFDGLVSANGEKSGSLSFGNTGSYSDGDTINWEIKLEEFGDTASGTIDVNEPPDISLQSVDGPNEIGPNDDLDVQYTLENNGGDGESGLIDLKVDGTDSTFDDTDNNVFVPGGGTTTNTLTLSSSEVSNFFSDGDTINWEVSRFSGGSLSGSTTLDVPPDIQVTDISAPNSVNPGDNIDFQISLDNSGGSGSISVDIDFASDCCPDGSPGEPFDETVSAGGSKTVTWTYSTSSSDAGTDITAGAGESVSFPGPSGPTTTVTVKEPANFDVSITGTNSPILEGDTLDVDVKIENTGDLQDTQNIDLSSSLGSDTISSLTLSGGQEVTRTLSVSTSSGDAGSYNPTVSSDDTSDSTNVQVDKPAFFDVSIQSVNSPVEGNSLDVTANIDNTGDRSATQTITLEVPGLGSASTDVSLNGGGSKTPTLSVGTGSGDADSYTATVSSEDDTASTGVQVKKPANLQLKSIDYPDKIASGQPLQVDVTVENTGGVSGTDTIELVIDGTEEDSVTVTVSADSEKTKTLSYDQTSSVTQALVDANLLDVVEEGDAKSTG